MLTCYLVDRDISLLLIITVLRVIKVIMISLKVAFSVAIKQKLHYRLEYYQIIFLPF